MLGKVFLTSKSFSETCAYVSERQDMAKVLAAEGVRAHNHQVMAQDFEWQHQLYPSKEKPVFHAALTFPRGEVLSDAQLVEIGRKYLTRIEMTNTQYVMVKHTDKKHQHVHIVANRIDNDGVVIGKGLIIERSIKAAAELTKEYGLEERIGKRLAETKREALHLPDLIRYKIYDAVTESLTVSRGLGDLERELLSRGVTMKYKEDAVTGKRQGVSFRMENYSFKGSRVDKGFSLRRLEKRLELQKRQELVAKLKGSMQEQGTAERLRESMKKPDPVMEKRVDKLKEERALVREVERLQEQKQQQQQQEQALERGRRQGRGLSL